MQFRCGRNDGHNTTQNLMAVTGVVGRRRELGLGAGCRASGAESPFEDPPFPLDYVVPGPQDTPQSHDRLAKVGVFQQAVGGSPHFTQLYG